MADIKLDIEVNGTRDLKQAADQMLRTGSVSRKLAKDFSATAAANSRLVTETRRVEAVKKQLKKQYMSWKNLLYSMQEKELY